MLGQCSFLLQNAHRKHGLKQDGGCVYIYNLFIFSPYRYSSSTQLTRHKIQLDTPKSFDPPLRTKPNYSLSKLLPQEPQQNIPIPHHLSPTTPNYPAPPKS